MHFLGSRTTINFLWRISYIARHCRAGTRAGAWIETGKLRGTMIRNEVMSGASRLELGAGLTKKLHRVRTLLRSDLDPDHRFIM